MTLSPAGWGILLLVVGLAVAAALLALGVVAALRPSDYRRKWATPVLRGRTLEERLLEYVRRRNSKRNDFDDVEAAVALGVSTRHVAEALHALQRKGLVKAK